MNQKQFVMKSKYLNNRGHLGQVAFGEIQSPVLCAINELEKRGPFAKSIHMFRFLFLFLCDNKK